MNSNSSILFYLSAERDKLEEQALNQALGRIEQDDRSCQFVPEERWREFSIRRLFASGNLSRRQGYPEWDRVNEFIHCNITAGESPNIQLLKKINAFIHPLGKGRVRMGESRGGEKQFIRQKDLLNFLKEMKKEVFGPSDVHPIWQAFQLYSWGVTLHPFMDGNGRTFRAGADWILLQNGYLPLTCRSSVAAHVAVSRNVPLPKRSSRFKNFLTGLMNSYDFVYQ